MGEKSEFLTVLFSTYSMLMASEYLGIMLADLVESGESLPHRSKIKDLSLIEDNLFKDDEEFDGFYDLEESFISMVFVDVEDYLGGQELIKKHYLFLNGQMT